jgi:transcriptional regulator with XRE-family HTH domain
MVDMKANPNKSAATHFGRQMQKERMAHGWSLREMSARTKIDFTTLSRIENGNRPPNEKVARACDQVFPKRNGWFYDYYEESKTWMLPGFRDWPEIENKAAGLRVWSPTVLHGLLQTEQYARELLETWPDVTPDVVATRLASRMERQRRVFTRHEPPILRYIIDHTALYRRVGSPLTMAGQMAHLLEVAALPNVTMHVLPAVGHPATQSGFVIADDATYTEHAIGGLVFSEAGTIDVVSRLFDTLRDECYRVSESLTIIRKAGAVWTGESQATAGPTAETAWKLPVAAE